MFDGGNEERLNRLFAEYRESVADPEPTPYFMPKLWQRIEARRTEPLSIFKRLAQVCVMTTLALALLMSVIGPELQKDPGITGSYVDVLAAEQSSNFAAMLIVDDAI